LTESTAFGRKEGKDLPMAADDPGPTERLDRRNAFVFRRFQVTVILGRDTGLCCRADRPELSIGTAPGNDLVLTDGTVSRHHCVIEPSTRGFRVRDLGSTNGTLLGPHTIETAHLAEAAVLTLGATRLRFEVLDETVAEDLSADSAFGSVLGSSAAMRRIFALIPRIAASTSTVLLEGETGTGKTLLAEAIHNASPRAAGPWVVVDCAAIPSTLVESELFGHERGAFTGADVARGGAFEAAQGGSLFLDEIGELPLDVQPKLLGVLESRSVKRLGSRRPVSLDARVIAATNRDLRAAVNAGSFRADLFFRLDIVRLTVPPLRERVEDIALLVEHFYRQMAPEEGAAPPPALVRALSQQRWTGNVRELRAAVERAVLFGDPGAGSAAAGPTPSAPEAAIALELPFRVSKQLAVDEWERVYLRALVARAGGSIVRAARMARMDRNYLRERLVRLGISVRADGD
jgi:two-component system, NtrC family, response regulator GlrR